MQNDTQQIITYCYSTVNIATMSYRKYSYSYSCEIELKMVKYELLYIETQRFYYFRYVLYLTVTDIFFLQILNLWYLEYFLTQFFESVKEFHKLPFQSTT